MATSIAKVIDQDFCIGCGLCTAIDPGFRIGESETGLLRVVARPSAPATLERASRVCPFGDAPDEDAIAAIRFPAAPHHHEALGRYEALYAGHSEQHRKAAGSGGITRWLMSELLDRGEIDFVVAVDRKLKDEDGDLFTVALHDSSDAFLSHTSTSAYFPISLDRALAEIRARGGRFAVTALPCFARALRAYALTDAAFDARMVLVSGTICGALKGRRYADYLSWQMGVAPDQLGRINFRGKALSRTANEKCVEVWSGANRGDAPDANARVQQLRGTDYGSGYFKPKACDYCDDVFAVTADISFGDAWISPYKDRPQGTNVVVVRNPRVKAMLEDGVARGELSLDPLTPDQARLTQNSGLRHRRQGLAVRLSLARLGLGWTPRKRVRPGFGSAGFVASQIVRILIRRVSQSRHLRPESRNFGRIMWRLVKAHDRLRPHAIGEQSPGLGRLRPAPALSKEPQ